MGEGRSHRDKVFQEKGFIMNTEVVWNFLSTQGADFGLKILGAIAAWVVGRWLIALAVRLIGAALEKGRKIDATLTQYLKSIISVLLTLVLVLAMFSLAEDLGAALRRRFMPSDESGPAA